MNESDGVLVLEGPQPGSLSTFEGKLAGATPTENGRRKDRGYGEVVFNTSMSGYQEILTDPSYAGQIICMTYPHIGNTGINLQDNESAFPHCAGLVVHDLVEVASNWRSTQNLPEFLKQSGIPALTDIDTRKLTLLLRSNGVMRGLILDKKDLPRAQELFDSLPLFSGRDFIREVSVKEAKVLPAKGKKLYRVCALDFGVKQNSLDIFSLAGCEVVLLPADSTASTILSYQPDGLFLSNGPGDPERADYAVTTLQAVLGKLPVFGICMGHQILSLALGAKTFKLKFGHRGSNQPVLDRTTGKVQITPQNHGYAVEADSLPQSVQVTHVHLNDQTVAGISAPDKRAFSVQFHPEASPGPHDSRGAFDRFIGMMRGN